VALLRITLSLIFVVCAAAPAAAQFATSDLAGLWTIQGAETASSASGTGGWVAGAVAFNDTGQVLSGVVVNDRGEQTPLEAGSVSVSSDGSFSGTIRTNTSIDVRGRILPGKQVLVTVTTSDQDIARYSLAILVKATGGEQPLFSQGDLTGTWRSASLLIPGFQASQAETLDGSITFDAQGGISGATLRSSNGSVISAVTGNLALVANGAFAGAFSFEVGGPVVDVSGYEGSMSPDKTLLVGITTRIQETFSVQQNGIFVLQREPSGPFTMTDVGGHWDLFSLQSKTNQGNVGEWLKGNISVTSNGRITGSLTGPGLEQDDIVDLGDDASNRLKVDPNGSVSGNIVTKRRILTLQGTINTAKDRIAGVDVLDPEEDFLGFFTLLKAAPPPSTVQFQQPVYSVKENVATAVITAVRTGASATPFTVTYTAIPITAVRDVDFKLPPSNTLTFAAGVLTRTISVTIVNNTLVDGNRSFMLTLGQPTNGVQLGPQSTTNVIIQDDELPASFQFSAPTFNVKEGTPNAVITVLRTGTLTRPATLTYSATPGTAQPVVDFTPVSGTLTFPANTPSRTFNVPIINNTRLDGTRTVALALGTTTGGAQLGTQRTATLNIEDNEQAGTFKLDKSSYTVLESAGFVSINVIRSGLNLTGNVSVNLIATDGTAKNGTNYTAPATPPVFAAGETTKLVRIPILRDSVVTVTGPLNFTLALSEPSSGATVGTPGSATVNITEADSMVQFSGNFIGNFPEVVRLGNTANEAFVDFDSIDGTALGGRDYTPTKGTITFKANTRATTIPLVIVNDILAEGCETFTYRLKNPRGTRLGPSDSQKTFTITDNDYGGDNIQFKASSYSGAEGKPVALTITRTGAFGSSLVVQWSAGPAPEGTRSATPGVDFSPASGSVTFAQGAPSATFTIHLLPDNLVEGLEAAVITLSVLNKTATLGAQSSTILEIQDVAPPASED
jgi:Calx-beta domain